jgi:putative restriction endonuclease
MTRGVLLHRQDSIYDDEPERQYQFPAQYLSRASQFVGDWILYYEPRRGPTGKGYYAIAKVERIIPDPSAQGMYLALIGQARRERPCPSRCRWRRGRGVLNEAGRISGRAQAATARSVEDFNRILDRGLPDEQPLLPREGIIEPTSALADPHAPYLVEAERERVEIYSSRIVRDRIFRKVVLDAYDCQCAISGLKLINGGGRAEVEAAHIKPVEAHGPDIINNGMALSGTIHWMFDRGLISLSDDLDIMVSRQVNDVDRVWGLVNQSRRAKPPVNPALRPHPRYLAWHRDNCFKH